MAMRCCSPPDRGRGLAAQQVFNLHAHDRDDVADALRDFLGLFANQVVEADVVARPRCG